MVCLTVALAYSYLTVVEDPPDVLGVDSTGEVGVAVVASLPRGSRDFQKLVPDEVFGSDYLNVFTGLRGDWRKAKEG
jgi:hypothetical protein